MITYYTYVYRDPATGIPRYVGKGSGGRSHRHLKRTHNKTLGGWLRSLLKAGETPKIEIYQAASEDLAFSLEIWFIHKYGRKDIGTGPLFNNSDGGDQPPSHAGRSKSKEHRLKIGLSNTGKTKGLSFPSRSHPSPFKGRTDIERLGEERAANAAQARSKSKIGNSWNVGKPKTRVQCSHCSRMFAPHTLSQWHGTKCKLYEPGIGA